MPVIITHRPRWCFQMSFCPNNSPKILTFGKLEPGKVWHFCSKMTKMIIKIVVAYFSDDCLIHFLTVSTLQVSLPQFFYSINECKRTNRCFDVLNWLGAFQNIQERVLRSLLCVEHFCAARWCQMTVTPPPCSESPVSQGGCWASRRSDWLQTRLSRPSGKPERAEGGRPQRNLELE